MSTLSLITISFVADQANFKRFIDFVSKYEMLIGSEYSGWCGFDSEFGVKALYLAQEYKLPLLIGAAIRKAYENACTESGLRFAPNLKGLLTIIRALAKRNSLHESL